MQRRSAGRIAATVFVAGIAIAAAGAMFGARGLAGAAALSLLGAAWRHDNQVGVCLPLAILFLIVTGVLCLLIYLLLIAHVG